MKREPWQPQCPEVAAGGEQCDREEGHRGLHESENVTWGYQRLWFGKPENQPWENEHE